MLEHAILLVYGSEDDWAEHREPLEDVVMSKDSSVELYQEAGEVRRLGSFLAAATAALVCVDFMPRIANPSDFHLFCIAVISYQNIDSAATVYKSCSTVAE